jgi:hypothetical protein
MPHAGTPGPVRGALAKTEERPKGQALVRWRGGIEVLCPLASSTEAAAVAGVPGGVAGEANRSNQI